MDEDGKLYFDRAVKGQAERKRHTYQWPKKPMYNAVRSAVACMLAKKAEFEKYMKPGDYTDCEVLFESVPNAIEYGKNMIVVHDAKYNYLVKKIKKAKSKIDLYFYQQGSKKVEKVVQEVEYIFGGKEIIKTGKYQLSINGDIDRLEKFISEPNKRFKDISNFDVLGLKAMGEWKDDIKKEKIRLKNEIHKLQINIKDKLIDQILNKIPASNVAPPPVFDEDGNNIGGSWPEGIVIKDLSTGDLTKVVSVFPEINKYLWYYREMAMAGAGPAGSFVPGVMMKFKTDVADNVFHIPQLKAPGPTSRIKKKYPGQPANEKLLFFLKDQKFNFKNVNSAKSAFLKAVQTALKNLKKLKDQFEVKGKNATLKVKKGTFKRDVKYDPVHIRKTYETFLDVENELIGYQQAIKKLKSKTPEGLAVQLLRIFLGARNMKKLNESYRIQEEIRDILRESLLEAMGKGTKVGILVGRFQPATVAHFGLIKKALKENDVVYVFVAGQKTGKDNPLPYKIREKVLKKVPGKVVVKPASTGFMPGLVEDNVDLKNASLINVYAGSDRVKGYEKQFDQYWEHPEIAIKVNEIKRDPKTSVSGTKVRNAIKSDDIGTFMSMMPGEIPDRELEKLFKLYQRYI